jgi:hypothetical protein
VTYDQVVTTLKANGFDLPVQAPQPPSVQHHTVQLLGVRIIGDAGRQIAEVGFACCGQPITLFISRQADNWSPHELDLQHLPRPWSLGQRDTAQYRLLAVGPHDVEPTLNLFL